MLQLSPMCQEIDAIDRYPYSIEVNEDDML